MQKRAPVGEHLQEFDELRPLVACGRVNVEELADLGERETEALTAQDELDARALALAVDSRLALAPWRDESLILVESNRPRRQRELLREVGDGIGRTWPLAAGRRLSATKRRIDGRHSGSRDAANADSAQKRRLANANEAGTG